MWAQKPLIRIVTEVEGEYLGEGIDLASYREKLNAFHISDATYYTLDSANIYVSYSLGDTTTIYRTGLSGSMMFDADRNEWKNMGSLVRRVNAPVRNAQKVKWKKTGNKKKILGRTCVELVRKSPKRKGLEATYQEVWYRWVCQDKELIAIADEITLYEHVFMDKGVVMEEKEEEYQDDVLVNMRTTKTIVLMTL